MKEQWIIGICDTSEDGVDLISFYGTETEVKEKLIELVKRDASAEYYSDIFEDGTSDIDEIGKDYTGAWYAYGMYHDFHIDYSAKKLSDILENK